MNILLLIASLVAGTANAAAGRELFGYLSPDTIGGNTIQRLVWACAAGIPISLYYGLDIYSIALLLGSLFMVRVFARDKMLCALHGRLNDYQNAKGNKWVSKLSDFIWNPALKGGMDVKLKATLDAVLVHLPVVIPIILLGLIVDYFILLNILFVPLLGTVFFVIGWLVHEDFSSPVAEFVSGALVPVLLWG